MDEQGNSDRWEHSAIESLVLLHGPVTSELAAVRMAIVELVVRQALTLKGVERRFLGIVPRQTNLLLPGPAMSHRHPEPLKAVLSRYRALEQKRYPGGETGVPMADLARAMFGEARRRTLIGRLLRKQPPETKGFVETVMLPHLARLGWLRSQTVTTLSIFATARWEITPAGLSQLERLRQIVDNGTIEFPKWVRDNPAQAERFVEFAGPALLLIPGIAPHIRALDALMSSPAMRQRHPPAELTAPEGQSVGNRLQRPVAAGAFSLVALAGVFGPGEFDGFDSTMYAVSEDLSLIWESIANAGGGAGG